MPTVIGDWLFMANRTGKLYALDAKTGCVHWVVDAASRTTPMIIKTDISPSGWATFIGERPALNEMVRWGQLGPAFWLLAMGASPNVPDPDGWTAVHQAVSRGNERLLRALLEHGGDRTARNAAGKTPLHLARAKGKAKIVAVLEE